MARPNLAQRLEANIRAGEFDPLIQQKMRANLYFSKLRKFELKALEALESSQRRFDLGISLGPCLLDTAQIFALPADAPFGFKIPYRDFDPFNQELIHSDLLNYESAIRDHFQNPKDYGNAQTWIVWVSQSFDSLARYQVSGSLAALRLNFPDALTASVMRDCGLDLCQLKIPRAILRIG